MYSRIVLLAWLFSCVSASQAFARGKAESPDKAAKKACAAGDFRKGVEILADLYVRTDDPTHIYNQGRCYEQNHQWESAIDRFREYLRKEEKISPKLSAEVEKHIADCRRFQEEETARTAPPPEPAPAAPPAQLVTPPPPVVLVEPPPSSPAPMEHPGSALRTTGIVVGSAGIATLATAIALNLKANSLANDANRTQDPSTKSSQQSYKTGAIVCYGIGGVAVLTGATLYLLGHAKGAAESQSLALVPKWSPGEAGLLLRGGF